METQFRRDLLAWLAEDAALVAAVGRPGEEEPEKPSPPSLTIAASASTDWSTKDRQGRDIRLALELVTRGEDEETILGPGATLERRVATFPSTQPGYRVAVVQFLRSRSERRKGNIRAVVSEWRFLILDTQGDSQ